jgi:hypothetical protein
MQLSMENNCGIRVLGNIFGIYLCLGPSLVRSRRDNYVALSKPTIDPSKAAEQTTKASQYYNPCAKSSIWTMVVRINQTNFLTIMS